MKRFLFGLVGLVCILGFSKEGQALTSTASPVVLPTSVSVSSVSIAGAQAQVTVSTPTANIGPYSSGYYNYLTHIRIEMYAAGALTGGATPVTCTTSNLNGVVYKFPTAAAIGTLLVDDIEFTNAWQSPQGSQVQITCPATASVIWNINVNSYQSN